jgi:hypothetical protein
MAQPRAEIDGRGATAIPDPKTIMLRSITPVILTWNEAPNIARTLACLGFAREIVVVDSGSSDATLEIIKSDPRVRLFERSFDSHGRQWHFAIFETGITTPWVLRLDADYQVTPALVEELAQLDPAAPFSAYRVRFSYAVCGVPLSASLYPANTVLFRPRAVEVFDDGHTEGWRINGHIADLRSTIVHDDRKSVEHWLGAQGRYMRRELPDTHSSQRGLRPWLRSHPPLMPIAAFLYCLFGKGLIRDGQTGIFYALQRLIAEAVLALMVIETKLGQQRVERGSGATIERDKLRDEGTLPC